MKPGAKFYRVEVRFNAGRTIACPTVSAARRTITYYFPKARFWALMQGEETRWYATARNQVVAEVVAKEAA